jgi:hypothetical protein
MENVMSTAAPAPIARRLRYEDFEKGEGDVEEPDITWTYTRSG